jgi:hypothetical protein
MAISKVTQLVPLRLRDRVGQLLIFRLMARGFRRPLLETTISSRSSLSTLSWNTDLSRGGEGRESRHLPSDHAHGVQEG